MESLKNIGEQLRLQWNQASLPGRFAFVFTAILCIALIAGVGIWSSQPQYVPLASNLSPNDAAKIISDLEAEKIRYKLNFSGSTVLVAKSEFRRARSLVSNVVASNVSSADAGASSFFRDPADGPGVRRAGLERQIAEMLMRMEAVETAAVTIGRPEPSPFVRDKKPTTASVMLKLRANASFSGTLASAVVAMVSNSVEGLDSKNITVVDTLNRILWSGDYDDQAITSHFDYQRALEAYLKSEAEMMLLGMPGNRRAKVVVRADVDFTSSETTERKYDPNSKAVKKEHISSTNTSQSQHVVGGPAGTAANQNPNPGSSQMSPSSEKTETSTIEYDNTSIVGTIKEHGGDIKRLTVSVAVQQSTATGSEDDKEKSAASQPPLQTKEDIERIVKTAVGFDERRNDKIEVVITKFNGVDPAGGDILAPVFGWDDYVALAKQVSLGVAAMFSFAFGFLLLRKLRPVVVSTEADSSADQQQQAATRFLSQARENPEAVARIIAAWLGDSGIESDSTAADSDRQQQ